MANLTKTQLRAKLQKLYDLIEEAKSDLDDLQNDAESERDDIEPYDGMDDLTEQQMERYEWFDSAVDQIGYAVDNMQDALDNLSEVID